MHRGCSKHATYSYYYHDHYCYRYCYPCYNKYHWRCYGKGQVTLT